MKASLRPDSAMWQTCAEHTFTSKQAQNSSRYLFWKLAEVIASGLLDGSLETKAKTIEAGSCHPFCRYQTRIVHINGHMLGVHVEPFSNNQVPLGLLAAQFSGF